MHECCKAVNGPKAMTSVMSLYSISFFLHSYTHSRAKTHILYILVPNAHSPHSTHIVHISHFQHPNPTRVPLSHGGQVYPTTRLRHETLKQQGMFPQPYRKTLITYVMAIDSTITRSNHMLNHNASDSMVLHVLY